jgi:hypothetical protein
VVLAQRVSQLCNARRRRKMSQDSVTLLQLEDGTLVEAWAPGAHTERISGGLARIVASGMDRLAPAVVAAARSVLTACDALSNERKVEELELELGLGFEAEGNVYVTRSMATANVVVRLKFRP